MHDINVKIIGAQQATDCEFKMRAIKTGYIHYGNAVCSFGSQHHEGLQCCFLKRNGLPLNSEQPLSWLLNDIVLLLLQK
jgi:hypothetical protein